MLQKIINGLRYYKRKSFLRAINLNVNGCTVLLYHRVSEYESDPQLLCVTPGRFEKHLQHLKKNYSVLHPDVFADHLLNKKKFPKNAVLITFDDGYADNYIHALPLLEKHELAALFYICTGNLNTNKEFWWDEAERMFLLNSGGPAVLKLESNQINYSFDMINYIDRYICYEKCLKIFRNQSAENRNKLMNEISQQMKVPMARSTHRSMNLEELKMMHRSKFAVIGAHTVGHPSLGHLTREEQQLEIGGSKEFLERTLSTGIQHFSYPFGTKSDLNDDSIDICRELNFRVVAANYPENVSRWSNRYAFPRFLVRDWDEKRFSDELKLFQAY